MVIEMHDRGRVLRERLAELNQPLDYYDQDRADRLWRQQHQKLMWSIWVGALLFSVGAWVALLWHLWRG